MNNLQNHIECYLNYCKFQKRLDKKTLKAYRIDLQQFSTQAKANDIANITHTTIENYIEYLHIHYQPKTVKRKIASLKAFFNYLEYREFISKTPFSHLQIHFREPIKLPKTIPLNMLESLLSSIYTQIREGTNEYQRRNALRDAAIIELLFSSGMRISELCALRPEDINLFDGTILIYGKGSKERRIQIGSEAVIAILNKYSNEFKTEIMTCKYFFVNQNKTPVSDQAIRRMINKHCSRANINMHITPHMFRHTFATSLLEADVDIRYIQEMLGHSSINVTEIYTHVAVAKQRDILISKHPRKDFNF